MVYAIIGRREQGKTTLMYWMGSRIGKRLIFDPRRMIQRGCIVTNKDDLAIGMEDLIDGRISEVTFQPARGTSIQQAFEVYSREVAQWVEEQANQPCAFLIDEANKDFIDTDVESFQWAMRCSARQVHHIMLTAHRPVDITTKVRALVDHWCLFAVRQEDDLAKVRERCSPEVAALVQRLDQRQFIHWNDAKGTHETKLDSEEWRVELAPPIQIELPGQPPNAGLDGLHGQPPLPAKKAQGGLFM